MRADYVDDSNGSSDCGVNVMPMLIMSYLHYFSMEYYKFVEGCNAYIIFSSGQKICLSKKRLQK
jgi:hypothetical protein